MMMMFLLHQKIVKTLLMMSIPFFILDAIMMITKVYYLIAITMKFLSIILNTRMETNSFYIQM